MAPIPMLERSHLSHSAARRFALRRAWFATIAGVLLAPLAPAQGGPAVSLDTARAAISIHSYIDGLLYGWLLAPDSFELHAEAERWVDTGLDMLRLSPSLRK